MLPQPGTPSFLKQVLDHISSRPSIQGWPINPELFSAFLLTLIVNAGGLIVNIPRSSSLKGKRKAVGTSVHLSRAVFGRKTLQATFDAETTPEDVARLFETPDVWDGEELVKESIPSTLVIEGLEYAQSPARIKLCDILVRRRIPVDPGHPLQPEEEDGVPGVRVGVRETSLPHDFLVVWVRDEDGPELPGWMLDQFAANVTVYPSDLAAVPVMTTQNIVGERPIPPQFIANLHALLVYTHIHPPLQIYISNLLSALSAHPRLKSTLTSRAVRLFPQFTRAHRLLASPYDLPAGWEEGLKRRQALKEGKGDALSLGLGGGIGGVDTWGCRAGEEPDVRDLAPPGVYDDEEGEVDSWYAIPENVQAVWALCMRHRTKARGKKGELMWILKGPAEAEGVPGGGLEEVDEILQEIIVNV